MKSNFLHLLVLCFCCLSGFQTLYGQAFLIKDINPGVGWSEIDLKFRIGNQFYFVANSEYGKELLVSDGSTAGTNILKDIDSSPFVGANPENFIAFNGTWFFTANDGISGKELWTTDGTTIGTTLFLDIKPGPDGSSISGLTVLNGAIYFVANDGTHGIELWKSDGTISGTEMVADIFPGAESSNPESMIAMGNTIVFVANDGINGAELWKTDGTESGTTIIKDIYPGIESAFPHALTTVGDKVYFIADDGTSGKEVWRTDGTTANTSLTTDILPGLGHPKISHLNAAGDYLFFVADDGIYGEELYRSDANNPVPSAEMVEIFPDTFGSTPRDFTLLNGDLIFNANNGINGYEIWKANASDGEVSLIKDIYPGFTSSSPEMLAVLNNELIFKARGEGIGFELWKTDGTNAGTVLLGDLNTDPDLDLSSSDPTNPVIKDGILYFSATDYVNGYQIWRTDGSPDATQRLTNIPHDTLFNNSHKLHFINNIGNEAINFVGLTDDLGEELWSFEMEPLTINEVLTNSPLICNGDTNGMIDITISGGIGTTDCYTYTWNDPGFTGLQLTDLPAGIYTLTVTDCVGFEVISTIEIEQPDPVNAITLSSEGVSCADGTDGQATISGIGGTAPYSYLWANGSTNETITGLNAGSHSVTITDINDCIGIGTVTISEPDPITIMATAGPGICLGANNGQANVISSGGTPNYTYLWDNGETGPNPSSLTSGNHNFTVTDQNGCTENGAVFISTLSDIEIDFSTQDVSCINGNNGSLTANPSGGSGMGYTYSWDNGSSSQTILGLPGGEYCVTVTDSEGCIATACDTILTPLVSTAVVSNISCFGANDGMAMVNIENANSTYSYNWDNGETDVMATMLSPGTHTVTVTDALTCFTIVNVMITQPSTFVFLDSIVDNPSCFGVADGSITYNFSGGTEPYVYTWSNGTMTDTGTLSGLSGGTYCATVTDANNCETFNFCSTLEEPEMITTSLTTSADPTCFDVCNGSATVAVTSGNPGQVYIFTWSSGTQNGGETSTATNLCAGMNTVSVFDGTCEVEASIILNQPDPIIANIGVNNVTCFGAGNGSVNVAATGGMPPYTYEFSNGDTGLAAGEYTVSITDEFNCQIVETFFVLQPNNISMDYEINTPSCIGDADASVVPLPSGGTPPYSFEFSDGDSDLSAGTYMVTVTDVNDCVVVDTFIINDPEMIEISNEVNDISCFGAGDGSVLTTATGGTGDYTFEYSDSSDNLEAGNYQVTVTDGNGCTSTADFVIAEPDILSTEVTATNISCAGSVDGMISISAIGGTMPYTFESIGGFENLSQGSYFITTTDGNGCIKIDTAMIVEPAPLDISFAILSPISCFGASDGVVEVTLTGGTLPYSYMPLYNELSAGPFNIVYDDANGCGGQIIFSLSQPSEIVLMGDSTDASGTNADGTATVTASGGEQPYSYEWNTDPVQITATATGLVAGDYQVTVTDDEGCTSVLTVTVGMFVNTNELDKSLSFDVYPNPANEQVILDLEFPEAHDLQLNIYDSMGRLVYQKDLGRVQKENIEVGLNQFSQGVYWIQIGTKDGFYVKKLSVIKP